MARVAAIGFVCVLFAVVVLLRWEEGFSNVDDYLYAEQTRAYYEALPDPGSLYHAWRSHGSSTPALPTLAVPLVAIDSSPHWLVLVQIVPLLVLVLSVRSLLGSLGLPPRAAWICAGGVGALAPVMAYAAMYHFGLAAAAAAALAFAAYARSDRLARWRPAVVLGLGLGILALTRVVSPVYLAAVMAPIAVDVLWRIDRIRLRNAGLALSVGIVVGGPWWFYTGDLAWDYLVSAGYEESVFTVAASRPEIARERLDWTMDESGWLVSVVLAGLLVHSAVRVWRRLEAWRVTACLLGACAIGMGLLATSSNKGTAFALPFVVLGACAGLGGMRDLRPPVRKAAIAACAVAVAIPALALVRVVPGVTVADQPLWHEGIPAWEQGETALRCDGCDLPDTDALNRDVARVIGRDPTLMMRIDAVLNPNGLRYRRARIFPPATPGVVTRRELAGRRFVIAGDTPAPYAAPPLDRARFEATLRDAGYRPVLQRRLAPANTVEVWGAAP